MARKTNRGARNTAKDPDARSTTPAAEETNYNHPAAAGTRAVVPGAGVVSPGADAYPKETSPNLGRSGGAPGAGPCDAPQTAPGGRAHVSRDNPEGIEAPSDGGATLLNPPPQSTALDDAIDAGTDRTLAEDVPGINDPNYSAATYSDKTSNRQARERVKRQGLAKPDDEK